MWMNQVSQIEDQRSVRMWYVHVTLRAIVRGYMPKMLGPTRPNLRGHIFSKGFFFCSFGPTRIVENNKKFCIEIPYMVCEFNF